MNERVGQIRRHLRSHQFRASSHELNLIASPLMMMRQTPTTRLMMMKMKMKMMMMKELVERWCCWSSIEPTLQVVLEVVEQYHLKSTYHIANIDIQTPQA